MTRILHISGHEVFLNEVYNYSKKNFIFDYVLNKNGKDFRFKRLQPKANLFYVCDYQANKILWAYEIIKLVVFKKYKIVHIHLGWASAFLLPFLKIFNVKVIIHNHTVGHRKGFFIEIVKFLFKIIINYLSDERIATSKKCAEEIFFRKFSLLGVPINYDQFKFNNTKRHLIRQELNLDEENILCVMVGHYYAVKNHMMLVELSKKLDEKRFKFLTIGDDLGTKESFEKHVLKENKTSQFYILNSRKNICDYLSASDIFLMPSHFEGLGMSAIEAQVNGLPTLLSDTIPKEVKISDSVKFLPNCDLDQWVNQIKESKRTSISKNAFLLDGKYKSSNISKKLHQIYMKLCAD